MRYHEIIAESTPGISQSTYGYWVNDTGEFIPVDFEEHRGVLAQHGITGISGREAYRKAYDRGWVRIIAKSSRGDCNISLKIKRLTPETFKLLRLWMRRSHFLRYFIDSVADPMFGSQDETLRGDLDQALDFISLRYRGKA
jgi:hypothetical protein